MRNTLGRASHSYVSSYWCYSFKGEVVGLREIKVAALMSGKISYGALLTWRWTLSPRIAVKALQRQGLEAGEIIEYFDILLHSFTIRCLGHPLDLAQKRP